MMVGSGAVLQYTLERRAALLSIQDYHFFSHWILNTADTFGASRIATYTSKRCPHLRGGLMHISMYVAWTVGIALNREESLLQVMLEEQVLM